MSMEQTKDVQVKEIVFLENVELPEDPKQACKLAAHLPLQ